LKFIPFQYFYNLEIFLNLPSSSSYFFHLLQKYFTKSYNIKYFEIYSILILLEIFLDLSSIFFHLLQKYFKSFSINILYIIYYLSFQNILIFHILPFSKNIFTKSYNIKYFWNLFYLILLYFGNIFGSSIFFKKIFLQKVITINIFNTFIIKNIFLDFGSSIFFFHLIQKYFTKSYNNKYFNTFIFQKYFWIFHLLQKI